MLDRFHLSPVPVHPLSNVRFAWRVLCPEQASDLALSWLPCSRPAGDWYLCHHNDAHQAFEQRNEQGDVLALQLLARVQQLRERHPNCLWVSGGDDLGASAYDQLLIQRQHCAIHDLYQRAGLDVLVPGNHDLDYGLWSWRRQRHQHELLATVQNLAPLQQECPPLMLEMDDRRLLVIGLSTHEGMAAKGLTYQSPESVIAALRPLMASVDALVVLSHLGLSAQADASKRPKDGHHWDDEGLLSLLSDSPCPVVIVGGHSHSRLHQYGWQAQYQQGQALLVQAGQHFHYLGLCRWSADQGWQAQLLDLRQLPSLAVSDVWQHWWQRLQQQLQTLLAAPLASVSLRPWLDQNMDAQPAWARLLLQAVAQDCADKGWNVQYVWLNASSFAQLPPQGLRTQADLHHFLPYHDQLYYLWLSPEQLMQLWQYNLGLQAVNSRDALWSDREPDLANLHRREQWLVVMNGYPLLARGDWQALSQQGLCLSQLRQEQGQLAAEDVKASVQSGLPLLLANRCLTQVPQ